MARELSAYLSREKVPERKPLQQAIDTLKLPLKLELSYAHILLVAERTVG